MIAVTWPLSTLNDTPRTARAAPKLAESDSVATQAGLPASSSAVVAIGTARSITAGAKLGPRGETRREADDQDQRDEDERSSPRLGVLIVVGRNRIAVDLKR